MIALPGFFAVSFRRGWVLAGALIVLNAWLRAHTWQPNPGLPALRT